MVEDDTISSDEVESDGLERSESPQLNWMQKILGNARMGGIGGPLVREFYSPECRFVPCVDTNGLLLNVPLLTQLIQQRIFFNDDLATSTNKGGAVDGAESEVSNSSSKLASPSSRAVIVQDEDYGVSIHSIVDEDDSANVSKPGVSKDVLPEPKNLSLNLKADDDGQEIDTSVQNTTVDVSTLYVHCLNLLRKLFHSPFYFLSDTFRC